MKAITLPAPIATLTHTPQKMRRFNNGRGGLFETDEMVVRWLTADSPPPGDPPWRIAIHSGNGDYDCGATIGDFRLHWNMTSGWFLRRAGDLTAHKITFAAIVATAVVTEALPIIARHSKRTGDWVRLLNDEPKLGLALGRDSSVTDISDQLPYADWTPGRVALPLTDVQPTTVRCPTCWGVSVVACDCGGSTLHMGHTCPTCNRERYCPPIPMRGHAGWWEVTW